jgi:hypothetical protein
MSELGQMRGIGEFERTSTPSSAAFCLASSIDAASESTPMTAALG